MAAAPAGRRRCLEVHRGAGGGRTPDPDQRFHDHPDLHREGLRHPRGKLPLRVAGGACRRGGGQAARNLLEDLAEFLVDAGMSEQRFGEQLGRLRFSTDEAKTVVASEGDSDSWLERPSGPAGLPHRQGLEQPLQDLSDRRVGRGPVREARGADRRALLGGEQGPGVGDDRQGCEGGHQGGRHGDCVTAEQQQQWPPPDRPML